MAILSIYYYIICADKSKEKSQIRSEKTCLTKSPERQEKNRSGDLERKRIRELTMKK